MNFKDVVKQREATNEILHHIKAPFRLAFMTQLHDSDRSKRVTIEIGTPEQIEKGHAQNNLLYYAKINEASKFLTGFNAALAALSNFSAPVNQDKKEYAISPTGIYEVRRKESSTEYCYIKADSPAEAEEIAADLDPEAWTSCQDYTADTEDIIPATPQDLAGRIVNDAEGYFNYSPSKCIDKTSTDNELLK